MNREMTEILIGKFIDSEITPAEQRLLEAELARDPEARQLLEGLQELHRQTEQVLTSEVVERGEPARTIFDRALAQYKGGGKREKGKGRWWWQAAATVAAGVILTGAIYLAVREPSRDESMRGAVQEPIAAPNERDRGKTGEWSEMADRIRREIQGEPIRSRVDWYSYTDAEGNQWLLEAYPDHGVRPAVYEGEL